jgi:hypothetical protein
MRFFRRTVQPTLFLSESGVLVEALENHAFPPGGQRAASHLQEVPVPSGAAAVAVQFVHEVGTRFHDLQVFRLGYYHRAPGNDLFEEYLAVPYDRLQWVATPIDAHNLSTNQRRVLVELLSKSDAAAWNASEAFRNTIG